jgi:hypothetical protein
MAFTKLFSVSAQSSNNGDSVTTASVDSSGCDLIVINISDYLGATRSTFSDSKNNSATALTTRDDSLVARCGLLYMFPPIDKVGTGHTFTATKVSGATYPSIHVVGFSSGSAYDQQSGAGQLTVTSKQPGSLTPPADDHLFVSSICFDVANTMGIDSGFTLEQQTNYSSGQAMGGGIAYFIQTTAAAKNPTWSWGSNAGVGVAMATFVPGGAPDTTIPIGSAVW